MQLTELRTHLTNLLATDLDNYAGESPASADLDAQLNRAQDLVARYVRPRWEKVTISALTNDQQIQIDGARFNRRMMSLDGHLWKSTGNYLELLPFDRFNSLYDWRFASSGVPVAAALSQNNLWFDRPFSGNTTLYCSGVGYYETLVDGTDVPELPTDYHYVIPELAAILAAEPSVTDSVALNRLQMYQNRAFESLSHLRQEQSLTDFDLSY